VENKGLINRFDAAAPGFKAYLRGMGFEMDEEGNVLNPDWVRMKFRRGHSRGGGGGGAGGGMGSWLVGLIVVLFLAYIAMSLISSFAPTMGNLTYTGNGIGSTIFGLVQTWVLPLGLIGLLIYVVTRLLKPAGR